MTTCRRLSVLLVCALLTAAAPVPPEDDVAKLQRVYGTWSDPDKDCRYTLKGNELRVSLPAAWHLLWTNRRGSTNNAPRVLREVEGDFTAVVRVTFPVPERVPEEHWPYCSGGVVAWESDDAYYVVRRCGGEVNGAREAIWGQHRADVQRDSVTGLGKPAESAFVRLKREGKKATAGWSRDGKEWKEHEAAEVPWGAKVKVGVIAENCLGKAVEVTFDQYSLIVPKK